MPLEIKEEGIVPHSDDQAVLAAADRLVAAFGRHDRDAYFSFFAPYATFVFYNQPRRFENREEYEHEWHRWEAEDGFHVLSCQSSGQRVQCFGDFAIFTHSVHTVISTTKGQETLHERETIVFRAPKSGTWIAVHEHLSPIP